MSRSWTDEKERSNPFTLRLICWIALNLSRTFARLWLYPITLYFLITSPRVRFSSRNYLKRVPNKTGSLYEIAQHVFCFSATILDRVYFLTGQQHLFDVKFYGNELLDKVIDNNKGAILLGAHVGSFEALRCLAITNKNLPLKIMMYQDHNEMITKILEELNPDVTASVINLADGNALLQMKESIDKSYLIGMLGDRAMVGEKQTICRLLNDDVPMPTGPLILASILKIPVLQFYGIYLGGNKYSFHIEELTDAVDIPRNQRSDFVEKNIQKYTTSVENMIVQHPYNWFNFYDFWGDHK